MSFSRPPASSVAVAPPPCALICDWIAAATPVEAVDGSVIVRSEPPISKMSVPAPTVEATAVLPVFVAPALAWVTVAAYFPVAAPLTAAAPRPSAVVVVDTANLSAVVIGDVLLATVVAVRRP